MKKLLTAVAFCLAAQFAYSQGTVVFNNRDLANGIDARIFLPGGTAAGSSIVVQLWGSAPGGSLAAIGAAVPLRDGAGAGYINSTGQDLTRAISGVAAGAAAQVQIRAWSIADGATYAAASLVNGALIGSSAILNLSSTGGAGSPPSLPAPLIGLQGFTMTVVPEPSVIALAVIGAGALLLRRKR